jgi:CheY-like chemotaxis protein
MTPSQTTTARPARKTLRILYAEDMKELRQVAQMSLTRQGHTIECYANGADALARLTAAPDAFDVVITDHHMPHMSGLALIGALRRDHIFKGKIIVFCSALNAQVSAAYNEVGIDVFLKKPVFPSVLREALDRLFDTAPADPSTPAA